MQTITDLIVKNQTGKLFLVNHRSSSEHIVEGASMNLIMSGEKFTKTTNKPNAWINDKIDVLDYMGSKMFTGIVIAKSVRLWDMSKPLGQRLHSQKATKNFIHLKTQIDKSK